MTTPCEILSPCICGDLRCVIPFGFCHCGCGGKTLISSRNRHDVGIVKGLPVKFAPKHCRRIFISRNPFDGAPAFKLDGEYCKLVPLTRGLYSIVDADLYQDLVQYAWQAHLSRETKTYYATTCSLSRLGSKRFAMHRYIMGLGDGDQRIVDHIFGDTLDNRRKRLKITDHVGNNRNTKWHRLSHVTPLHPQLLARLSKELAKCGDLGVLIKNIQNIAHLL